MNNIPDTDDYYAFDEWQDLCELARCDDDPPAENFHHDLEETKSKDNSTSTEHEHNEQ